MILEQLIFTVLAFGIFVYMFFKMFKENDTNYIGILIIEAIKDTIAPSIRVLSKIFFNKKQTNHVMQMPTITMQTQSNILSPY